MNAATLRLKFPEECEPFSDVILDEICFLTKWNGCGGFWNDEDIRCYMRDWAIYESYSDVVEINEDIFELPEGWEEKDYCDKEEEARDMIVKAGYMFLTTEDHEVVVLLQLT